MCGKMEWIKELVIIDKSLWPAKAMPNVIRGPKDNINVRILQTMISGAVSPFFWAWDQNVRSFCVCGVLWAPSDTLGEPRVQRLGKKLITEMACLLGPYC